jgi:hypothetical protein
VAGKLKNFAEGIAGAAFMIGALLAPFLRSHRNRWGTIDAELSHSYPGDNLVTQPKWQWTHAVTIRTSTAQVWPWVVQIGQGRGGFYSYEFLENLVGCDIRNTNRIMPEWQNLKVGDAIKLHPKMPGLPVVILEPGRAIALHVKTASLASNEKKFAEATPQKYFSSSWLFFVDKVEDLTTRLISRWRADYDSSLASRLSYGPCLVEPIGFAMDRKMLLGIKQRGEAANKSSEVR